MAVAKALGATHPEWTRLEASNADEALARVNDADPDIAVFDFNMPGRDGLDLAAEVRERNLPCRSPSSRPIISRKSLTVRWRWARYSCPSR